MALWYECGDGLVKTSWARADLNADAYLCCPGPSLADVDPALFDHAGIMTFALNTAYPKVRPHVWIGLDDPTCYDPRVWWEPFAKVTRMHVQDGVDLTISGGQHLRYCPNTFFPDLEDFPAPEMFHRRAHDTHFIWNKNAFTFALHLMIWMGARRIRLVGCDFGGASDYHDDRVLLDDQRSYNRLLYDQLVDMLRDLQPAAQANGVEIISCTPGSPANEIIGYTPLETAVAESLRRVPAQPSPARLLHCKEAEMCRWATPSQGDGVVVGCAPTQEWMIRWWWQNYSQHNDLPVAFADFGLSDDMRDWCQQHGTLIDVTDTPAEGWFRKPFALLRSPFERVLWLDLDTEVRGNILPLLDMTTPEWPAMMLSTGRISQKGAWHERVPDDLPMYCTSIVAAQNGSSVIEAWAQRTVSNEADYQGDHEVMSELIYAGDLGVALIGSNQCQQHGTSPDILVRHWGGWSGKRTIREMMEKQTKNTIPAG